jgi:hypothetical protein
MIFDVAVNGSGFVPRKNCDIGCVPESGNVAFPLIDSGSGSDWGFGFFPLYLVLKLEGERLKGNPSEHTMHQLTIQGFRCDWHSLAPTDS